MTLGTTRTHPQPLKENLPFFRKRITEHNTMKLACMTTYMKRKVRKHIKKGEREGHTCMQTYRLHKYTRAQAKKEKKSKEKKKKR